MLVVGSGGVLPPEAGGESHGDVPGTHQNLAGEIQTPSGEPALGGGGWGAYLGRAGAGAGAGAGCGLETTVCTLRVVGVCAESWARGTVPIRYQIPMLFSSLSQQHRSIISPDNRNQNRRRVWAPPGHKDTAALRWSTPVLQAKF